MVRPMVRRFVMILPGAWKRPRRSVASTGRTGLVRLPERAVGHGTPHVDTGKRVVSYRIVGSAVYRATRVQRRDFGRLRLAGSGTLDGASVITWPEPGLVSNSGLKSVMIYRPLWPVL